MQFHDLQWYPPTTSLRLRNGGSEPRVRGAASLPSSPAGRHGHATPATRRGTAQPSHSKSEALGRDRCLHQPRFLPFAHLVSPHPMSSLADEDVLVRPSVGCSQGHRDGSVKAAFDAPVDVVLSSRDGSLFVCELGNHTIRRVRAPMSPSPVVETVAGTAGGGCGDGPCRTARFLFPSGIDYSCTAVYEDLLVADTGNGSLRMVDLVEVGWQGAVRSPSALA